MSSWSSRAMLVARTTSGEIPSVPTCTTGARRCASDLRKARLWAPRTGRITAGSVPGAARDGARICARSGASLEPQQKLAVAVLAGDRRVTQAGLGEAEVGGGGDDRATG